MLISSIYWGGVSSIKSSKNIVMCIPWGGTRTLPQGCAIVSWLLLPCLCIPSLPWLATVWICPLELRKCHGGWSLFPTSKEWGTQKGFRAQEIHRVLLDFSMKPESPLPGLRQNMLLLAYSSLKNSSLDNIFKIPEKLIIGEFQLWKEPCSPFSFIISKPTWEYK